MTGRAVFSDIVISLLIISQVSNIQEMLAVYVIQIRMWLNYLEIRVILQCYYCFGCGADSLLIDKYITV